MARTTKATAKKDTAQPATAVPDIARFGFQEAGSGSRFCKIGNYGLQGSGKSTTMAWIARLIAREAKLKTVYMIDSEGGADYIASIFKKEKIQLQALATREFGTLVDFFEAMKHSGELIFVDSITHFWNDVMQSFLKAKKRTSLRVQDWGPIFETWRMFTELFVTSEAHVLVCGRLGYEYETTTGEDGSLEFHRVDTKFKAGDQFGHEPSLLYHLAQLDNALTRDRFAKATSKKERAQLAMELKKESSIDFVCTIEKDRSRILQSQRFVFTPGQDDEVNAKAVEDVFRPVIDWHLSKTSFQPMQRTGATQAMLTPTGNEFEWQEKKRRRDIALDEIKATLGKYFPSATKPDHKQAMIVVCEFVFGCKGWEGIVNTDLNKLEASVKLGEGNTPSPMEQACITEAEKLLAPAAK